MGYFSPVTRAVKGGSISRAIFTNSEKFLGQLGRRAGQHRLGLGTKPRQLRGIHGRQAFLPRKPKARARRANHARLT